MAGAKASVEKKGAKAGAKAAARQYWLAKQEPAKYAWSQLVADGGTRWDGVRNYQARNFLAQWKPGDLVVMYHSNDDRACVGVMKVVSEPYADPTADDPRWVCADVVAEKAFAQPVTLAQVKSDPALSGVMMIRQSRLSVMPLAKAEFERIVKLGR